MQMAGSDGLHGGASWTRFWLWSLFPIVRAGHNADHYRSAFGRLVAEAVFWSPASLLPSAQVTWTELDPSTARVVVVAGKHSQAVDISLGPDGEPVKVVMARWSNANPARRYQLQPFGGYLSEFRDFEGYRLATHVDGGNWIDTDDYFPFYQARVVDISSPIGPRGREPDR